MHSAPKKHLYSPGQWYLFFNSARNPEQSVYFNYVQRYFSLWYAFLPADQLQGKIYDFLGVPNFLGKINKIKLRKLYLNEKKSRNLIGKSQFLREQILAAAFKRAQIFKNNPPASRKKSHFSIKSKNLNFAYSKVGERADLNTDEYAKKGSNQVNVKRLHRTRHDSEEAMVENPCTEDRYADLYSAHHSSQDASTPMADCRSSTPEAHLDASRVGPESNEIAEDVDVIGTTVGLEKTFISKAEKKVDFANVEYFFYSNTTQSATTNSSSDVRRVEPEQNQIEAQDTDDSFDNDFDTGVLSPCTDSPTSEPVVEPTEVQAASPISDEESHGLHDTRPAEEKGSVTPVQAHTALNLELAPYPIKPSQPSEIETLSQSSAATEYFSAQVMVDMTCPKALETVDGFCKNILQVLGPHNTSGSELIPPGIGIEWKKIRRHRNSDTVLPENVHASSVDAESKPGKWSESNRSASLIEKQNEKLDDDECGLTQEVVELTLECESKIKVFGEEGNQFTQGSDCAASPNSVPSTSDEFHLRVDTTSGEWSDISASRAGTQAGIDRDGGTGLTYKVNEMALGRLIEERSAKPPAANEQCPGHETEEEGRHPDGNNNELGATSKEPNMLIVEQPIGMKRLPLKKRTFEGHVKPKIERIPKSPNRDRPTHVAHQEWTHKSKKLTSELGESSENVHGSVHSGSQSSRSRQRRDALAAKLSLPHISQMFFNNANISNYFDMRSDDRSSSSSSNFASDASSVKRDILQTSVTTPDSDVRNQLKDARMDVHIETDGSAMDISLHESEPQIPQGNSAFRQSCQYNSQSSAVSKASTRSWESKPEETRSHQQLAEIGVRPLNASFLYNQETQERLCFVGPTRDHPIARSQSPSEMASISSALTTERCLSRQPSTRYGLLPDAFDGDSSPSNAAHAPPAISPLGHSGVGFPELPRRLHFDETPSSSRTDKEPVTPELEPRRRMSSVSPAVVIQRPFTSPQETLDRVSALLRQIQDLT